MKDVRLPIIVVFALARMMLSGQPTPFVSLPAQLEDDAYAEWITPKEPYGVFYFRKQVFLGSVPDSFIVHVSADARYRLYVNGNQGSWGPAVGDLENWNYETVDIAPHLVPGANIIVAQVWNWDNLNGARQQSFRTAFILQGNSPTEQVANSNRSWKVYRDPGYHALEMTREIVGGGYIAGGTDSVVAALQPRGWKQPGFDDSHWSFAGEAGKGNHLGLDDWKGTQWKLKIREIPTMEQRDEQIPGLLDVKGMPFPERAGDALSITIPPQSHVEILLDNRVLTMGFPQLLVDGGEGSRIRIRYQESLFGRDGQKGNRDRWEGKTMKGYYDVFLPDGEERLFEPLWVRVFRYVKLTIDTGDEPLQVKEFYNRFTAYPFRQKGRFTVEDEILNEIWDASWRTVRLCALETYMDCPYYEQLQYIGDTRIQALISMVVAGDDRMVKNAVRQLYGSMQPMGLTKSVHPTNNVQIIPPFSLLFIGMVHDYHMLRDDPDFISQFVPGIKFILEWFIGRISDNGILGPLPYWNHIDGGTEFINGSPPGISEGGSAHMTLLLSYALDHAVDLLDEFGYGCDADRFREISGSLKQKTMELCYNEDRGLIAGTPDKQIFSQHTNIFAILTGTFDPPMQKEVMRTVLEDSSLIQTTLYFKFYLFQALKKAGMGGEILTLMDEWKSLLDQGLTTFPEHGINSRSDCHAWAGHPMYDFLNITCGIASSSPGFRTVEIRPATGNLTEVAGSLPHPMGEISTRYRKLEGNRLECTITLPEKISGTLIYHDHSYPLEGGPNSFILE